MVVDQVTAFYRFHFAHDMGFTRETVKAPSVWLKPGLLKICAVYFANLGAPDEAPAINGHSVHEFAGISILIPSWCFEAIQVYCARVREF